jgi:hypothetical protein
METGDAKHEAGEIGTSCSQSGLHRDLRERSVGSTMCSLDRGWSDTGADSRSLHKSFKFRPRFADEGLEDLQSDASSSDEEDSDLDTPGSSSLWDIPESENKDA